jgi:DNA polymerase-4
MLRDLLSAMAENLAFQLRKGNKVCACVSVKIRYSDFNTHSRQQKIPYTNSDKALIRCTLDLFDALYQRRMLIRLVGVRFSDLVGGGWQVSLFDQESELQSLYQAMDKIRLRYGEQAVKRAAGMDAKSIGRGDNPFDGSPPQLLANRRH